MAVKLIANYAKRLGLPGYSSHQFSVSVETELTDLSQVQGEAARLYGLLQDSVDREIQQVGFVPGDEYGLKDNVGPLLENSSGSHLATGRWSCSDKQKELILKLVTEHELERDTVEELALDRFGAGVKLLNKLQASGLIGELLELVNSTPRHPDRNGSPKRSGNGSNGHHPANRKGGRA